MSQLQLLRERSCWPLFWMQFLGVFNEYALKCGLLLIALPRAEQWGWRPTHLAVLGGVLFSVASLLTAPLTAHFMAGRNPALLVRLARPIELVAVLLGAGALLEPSVPLCVGALALLGVHASAAEIVKLTMLPRLVENDELLSANALFTSGGFLAAFLGIGFGAVVLAGPVGSQAVAIGLVVVLVASALFAFAIPLSGPVTADERLPLKASIARCFSAIRDQRSVLLSSLGIAWFWFFAATMALAVTHYSDVTLNDDGQVAIVGFLLYCFGTTCGAFVCERLSQERLELGIVPLASIGITLFLFDLMLAGSPLTGLTGSWTEALLQGALPRVAFDLVALGVFTGIYLVPLRTLIQQRAASEQRVRILAASQVLSASFVAVALIIFGLLLASSWPPLPFLVLLMLNACVSFYIYRLLPEFLLRFVLWCVSRVMYRVRVHGAEFLPARGACVLVCNHVSFVDWMLIAAACPRPVRFVMYHRYLRLPFVGFLMRDAHVVPIAPAHEDAGLLDAAFDQIAQALEAGEVVCIFPEGKLTKDGNMNRFRTGIERVIARTPVPVIPMALDGMWGSYFSKKGGEDFRRPFRRIWSKVQLIVGPPIAPSDVSAAKLERLVAGLGAFDSSSNR